MKQKNIYFFIILFLFVNNIFAQQYSLDSLNNILETLEIKDTTKINTWNALSWQYKFDNPDTSFYFVEKSLKLAKEIDYKFGLAVGYRVKGTLIYLYGNLNEGLAYIEDALEVSKEIDNKFQIGKCYIMLGNFYGELNDVQKNIFYNEEALKIFTEIDNKEEVAGITSNMSYVFRELGNSTIAIEYLYQTLKIEEELNNKSGLARTYIALGDVYEEINDFPKAIECNNKAIEYCLLTNNKFWIAASYHNIGGIYRKQNKLDDAKTFFVKAFNLNKELNDTLWISYNLGSIADIFIETEQYDSALFYNDKSNYLLKKIDAKNEMVLSNYGDIYFKQGNYSQAKKFYSDYLELAIEMEELSKIISAYNKLYELETKYKNYKQANKYIKQVLIHKDSLEKITDVSEIGKLEASYEYEKQKQQMEFEQKQKDLQTAEEMKRQKAKTIFFIIGFILVIIITIILVFAYQTKRRSNIALTDKNKEIKQQKDEIQTQAEELKTQNEHLEELSKFKKLMTGTIIHDLKNPLNYIIGSSKDKAIRQSGFNMLNIVLNVLDVNKAQTTSLNVNLDKQNIEELIGSAILQVDFLAEQKNIKFEKIINKEFYINADKDLTIRVLVNLMTNAIKYSPLNNKVIIQVTENEKLAQIDVIDYGKGILPENIDKLFKEYSQIDAKNSGKIKSTGLGLTFCKIATEAQNAKINVSSIPNEKTTFSLVYPLISVTENKTVITSTNKNNALLTNTEKQKIEPILIKLKKIEIYKATEILNLLNNIENSSENIKLWKQKITTAIYAMNGELYLKLIDNEL